MWHGLVLTAVEAKVYSLLVSVLKLFPHSSKTWQWHHILLLAVYQYLQITKQWLQVELYHTFIHWPVSQQMLTELRWCSLEQRCCDAHLVLMYTITECLVTVNCSNLLHPAIRRSHNTHEHAFLPLIVCNTSSATNCPYSQRTIIQWNSHQHFSLVYLIAVPLSYCLDTSSRFH